MEIRGVLPALVALAVLLSGTAANANTVNATCADVGTKLAAASSGDTVILDGLCSGQSLTLPAVSNLTVEGAAGTTSGFDGAGASGVALRSPASGVDGLTIRNLLFRNYTVDYGGGLNGAALSLNLKAATGQPVVIDGDAFQQDQMTSQGFGGAVAIDLNNGTGTCAFSAPIAVTNSTFSGDGISDTTGYSLGGALLIGLGCGSGSAPVVLTGNTFANDTITHATGAQPAQGGAVWIGATASNGIALSLTQSGNVFTHDGISGDGSGSYGGGGEWTSGVDTVSTADSFVGDFLPAPATGGSSEGAGLGVERSGCVSGTTTGNTTHGINLVAGGNAIGAPTGSGVSEGAGIYAGCGTGPGHYTLTLTDSTVSGNQAPGGVAGVDGEDTDQLTLQNTIVAADSGAQEIGGFGGSGGSVSATYSDVCQAGSSSSPLPGAGNLCADPLLVGSNSSGFDAHETAASPTIDAGSNAVVPSVLTSDFFGMPRVQPRSLGCGTPPPGVVDIGAAEIAPVAPTCSPPPPPPPPSSTTSQTPSSATSAVAHAAIRKVQVLADDTIVLTVVDTGPGALNAVATVKGATTASAAAKRRPKKRKPLVYGRAGTTTVSAGTVTLRIKPGAAARALLKRKGRLTVVVKLMFTPRGARTTSPQKRTVSVRRATRRKGH